MSSEKQIIFISCGQRLPEEKQLGQSIADLVSDLTPFEPYFAEDQRSLQGLTQNIFGKLSTASGFIAVMHHRGLVRIPEEEFYRASVWIEQEIAIASFLEHSMDRRFNTVTYVQEGVRREGVREYLLLNPKEFCAPNDVYNRNNLKMIAVYSAP